MRSRPSSGSLARPFDEEAGSDPADGGPDALTLDAAETDAPPGAVASLFADPTSELVELAVTDKKLFFTTNPGGVKACDLAGCVGKPVVLAPLQKPRLFAYARDALFFFDPDLGQVRGVYAAGGPTFAVLAESAPKAMAPATNGLWISFGTFITRCAFTDTDGAACGPSPSSGGGAEVLASDGAYVYWVNEGGYVMALDSTQGYTAVVAKGEPETTSMFADTDRVFILRPNGNISVVSRVGGGLEAGVPAPIVSGIVSPGRLTVSGGTIYITHLDVSGVGEVLAVPVAGGTPSVLATGLDHPRAIAARDEYLYVGVAHGIVRIRR